MGPTNKPVNPSWLALEGHSVPTLTNTGSRVPIPALAHDGTRLDAWRPHDPSSRQGGYGPTDPAKRRVSMSLFGLLRLAFRLGYINRFFDWPTPNFDDGL